MYIIIGIMILKEIHARFGFGTGTTWGALMMPNPNQLCAMALGQAWSVGDHYIHTIVVSSWISPHFKVHCNCVCVCVCFCAQSTQETVENLNHAKADLEKVVAK